jgi:hypothetical protein
MRHTFVVCSFILSLSFSGCGELIYVLSLGPGTTVIAYYPSKLYYALRPDKHYPIQEEIEAQFAKDNCPEIFADICWSIGNSSLPDGGSANPEVNVITPWTTYELIVTHLRAAQLPLADERTSMVQTFLFENLPQVRPLSTF